MSIRTRPAVFAIVGGTLVFLAILQTTPISGRSAGTGGAKAWHFDADPVGKIAPGFVGEVGTWEVVRDGEGRVLAQRAKNSNPTFNVALVEGVEARDVDISVKIKAVAGELDQGGGLVWRARDAKNYYVARYNPLEENYRVYKVEAGKRTQLQSADVPDEGGWRTLRVTMTGPRIRCFLDGKELLDVADSTFPEAGTIGLWSKADAQTYFDDLTLASP